MKTNTYKKTQYIFLLSFVFFFFVLFLPTVSLAANYVPLADLPNMPAINPEEPSSLGVYIGFLVPLFISICAVLAVVMIVLGGMQYMTSELISSKEQGKERIRNALFGLLLALGAWLLLSTINPEILNIELTSVKNTSEL